MVKGETLNISKKVLFPEWAHCSSSKISRAKSLPTSQAAVFGQFRGSEKLFCEVSQSVSLYSFPRVGLPCREHRAGAVSMWYSWWLYFHISPVFLFPNWNTSGVPSYCFQSLYYILCTLPLCHCCFSFLRFLFFLFWLWIILKVLTEFVTSWLLVCILVFWPRSMEDLSSPTRDQTCTLYIGRQSLNHWTTWEIHYCCSNKTSPHPGLLTCIR